jgi:dTDP-4-dehydrorhamnose reductase
VKLLILGGNGMAGHMIAEYISKMSDHDVWYTIRSTANHPRGLTLDVMHEQQTEALLKRLQPDVVINTTGLLNEAAARFKREAIYVNSLLPHQLSLYGKRLGFRLIHISTDCVFSGERGGYKETDHRDGTTVYAKTKSLDEVLDREHVTVRTSIIGPELKKDGIGLFHWFMQQRGTVKGYKHVYWSGVTTLELAKALLWLMPRSIGGLVHLTSPRKISKLELLQLIQDVFEHHQVFIEPDERFYSDKSLINTRSDFPYTPPDYRQMLVELREWMEAHPER